MNIKNMITLIMVMMFGLMFFSGCSVNIDDNGVVVNDNNVAIKVNDDEVKLSGNSIKKTVSPSGFAGASMHKLNLYTNGDVHLVIYNGEGYDEENIISDEIIAKNATDVIQDEESEAIAVTGNNIDIVNSKYMWITFKKE